MNNKQIGKIGEDLACKFLLNNGFEIIDRNYQKRIGEIDLVAFKKGIIHFFEVKTVSRETLNSIKTSNYRPEDNVTLEKINKIEKTANLFLIEKGFKKECIQIDLLTVYLLNQQNNLPYEKTIGNSVDNLEHLIDYFPNINFR